MSFAIWELGLRGRGGQRKVVNKEKGAWGISTVINKMSRIRKSFEIVDWSGIEAVLHNTPMYSVPVARSCQ